MPSFAQGVRNAIQPIIRKSLLGQTVQIDRAQATITEVKDDLYYGKPVLIAHLKFENGETEQIIIQANLLEI